MKIYLAGASEEAERCARAMAELRAIGCTITEDWTVSVLEHGADEHLSVQTLVEASDRNVRGVRNADLLIVLVPENKGSIGWSFEMGVAHGVCTEIWWVGRRQSCFWTLANAVFDTFDEAMSAMRARRKSRTAVL